MLPATILVESEERQSTGFKGSEDWYTVGVCSSIDGSLRLLLILIGDSKNTQAVKKLSNVIL